MVKMTGSFDCKLVEKVHNYLYLCDVSEDTVHSDMLGKIARSVPFYKKSVYRKILEKRDGDCASGPYFSGLRYLMCPLVASL